MCERERKTKRKERNMLFKGAHHMIVTEKREQYRKWSDNCDSNSNRGKRGLEKRE